MAEKLVSQGRVAVARGSNLPLSLKHAVHIGKLIRGKSLSRAKKELGEVVAGTLAVPFRSNANGLGHRRGPLAAGRYPQKACALILSLVESAEKNAEHRGIDAKKLVITSFVPSKGPTVMRSGRWGGKAKNIHIIVHVGESV